jgi:hypothetical protein
MDDDETTTEQPSHPMLVVAGSDQEESRQHSIDFGVNGLILGGQNSVRK